MGREQENGDVDNFNIGRRLMLTGAVGLVGSTALSTSAYALDESTLDLDLEFPDEIRAGETMSVSATIFIPEDPFLITRRNSPSD